MTNKENGVRLGFGVMRYKFTKRERLKNEDFKPVLKEGVYSRSKYLIMYVKKNGLAFNRLGIMISKVVKKAVIRNRLKRLVREAFRTSKGELPNGYDIIVLPNFNLPDLSVSMLKNGLIMLLRRIHLKEGKVS